MNKFPDVETTALIEMLAQQTSQLTSLLVKTLNTKEYEDCKRSIEELQLEINYRTRPHRDSPGPNYQYKDSTHPNS